MGLITGIPGGLPHQGAGMQEGSESQQVDLDSEAPTGFWAALQLAHTCTWDAGSQDKLLPLASAWVGEAGL